MRAPVAATFLALTPRAWSTFRSSFLKVWRAYATCVHQSRVHRWVSMLGFERANQTVRVVLSRACCLVTVGALVRSLHVVVQLKRVRPINLRNCRRPRRQLTLVSELRGLG